jgi:hypothetical protein
VSTVASQNFEAVVIELPTNNLDPIRRVAGTISQDAGKCLIIISPEAIATSSSIRVQGKDLLFLGNVVHSARGEDGQWSVHMTVKSKFMIF